jgi:hypothetical protein
MEGKERSHRPDPPAGSRTSDPVPQYLASQGQIDITRETQFTKKNLSRQQHFAD